MSYLYEIAKRGVDAVLRSVPENRIIDTGIQTITKKNLDKYLESMGRPGSPAED